MPPRAREFALCCALLVALHAGAAGLLWTSAGAVETPPPETADPTADTETLLHAAAHNDAALPMTTDLRMTHPANDTTALQARLAAEPGEGRARFRTSVRRSAAPYRYDAVYVAPWGRWERRGDDWHYDGRPRAGYDATTPRLFFPSTYDADRTAKTVHDNGTVTVRIDGLGTTPGPLAAAGENATAHIRITFEDGHPYVVSATATPTDGTGLEVTVDRRRGAAVSRPEGLPPVTPREAGDRLVTGADIE